MAGENVTDLTSSYYALVVLATATMGLSTYIYKHYVDKFSEAQDRLIGEWGRHEANYKNTIFTEDVTKELDDLKVQRPLEILWPIAILAILLPYAALGQLLMVACKSWGQYNWLSSLMTISLMLAFALCLIAMLWIFYKLNRLRKNSESLKDRVDTNLRLADAQYRGHINNNKSNSKK